MSHQRVWRALSLFPSRSKYIPRSYVHIRFFSALRRFYIASHHTIWHVFLYHVYRSSHTRTSKKNDENDSGITRNKPTGTKPTFHILSIIRKSVAAGIIFRSLTLDQTSYTGIQLALKWSYWSAYIHKRFKFFFFKINSLFEKKIKLSSMETLEIQQHWTALILTPIKS